jgi:hypothetical protein
VSAAKYYRGPDEPGGAGEIIAEVVDGRLRRRIEHDGMLTTCVGYDEYPVNVDMTTLTGHTWEIDRKEFEEEWDKYCPSR